MPQWVALALLRPLRRVCEVPRDWNRRRRWAAPERSRAAFTGVFDVAVTGHMSDMPCRARLHRGYGAPGTDGHGRAMPEKCRSKVSEKWPLKLHPAFFWLRFGAERSFEEMRERQRLACMPGLVAGVYDKWDRLQGQGRSRTADGISAASVSTALRCV